MLVTTRYKLLIAVAVSILVLVGTLLSLDSEKEFARSEGLSRVYTKQPYHQKITTPKGSINSIMERGVLRIASRNAPTIYYHGADGPEGFEYDLVKDFADSLDVDLEILLYDSVAEVLVAVESGDVDMAAAGITQTQARQQRFLFGPVYQKIEQQVVCNRKQPVPKKVTDLIAADLHVIEDSSYVERLKELAKEQPTLRWIEHEQVSTEELLYDAANEEIGCVVSDSNIVKLNQRYFPNILKTMTLSDEQSLAWVINKQDAELRQAVNDWFTQFKALGMLEELEQHYYEYVPVFDYVDLRAFHRRIDSRLPKYEPYFQQSAVSNELGWVLLAAQAYQESHWNPHAKSPTGVRGMMMLTLPTAKQVGVESRLDPQQSIDGGARYLASLIGRLPKEIPEQTRFWYGLAAYNVGMGHLYDARNLATSLGKDPNNWDHMEQVLPLLAKKKYYTRLRYGYARGYEPVKYVKRIRHYRDILEQRLNGEAPLAESDSLPVAAD